MTTLATAIRHYLQASREFSSAAWSVSTAEFSELEAKAEAARENVTAMLMAQGLTKEEVEKFL